MDLTLDHSLGSVIPYRIDTPRLTEQVETAIEYVESVFNIDFQPVVDSPELIFYTDPTVDYSGLATHLGGGNYSVHLQFWSRPAVVLHELGHAMGVWRHDPDWLKGQMWRSIMVENFTIAEADQYDSFGNIGLVRVNMVYGMAESFAEELWGTPWGDWNLQGNNLANFIAGGDGADIITGYGGDDTLIGGKGIVDLSDDDDTIYAKDGDDLLYGNAGDDKLYGDAGNDTIYGGLGDDFMYGGEGADVFIGGPGADTIVDFWEGIDSAPDFNPAEGDVVLNYVPMEVMG